MTTPMTAEDVRLKAERIKLLLVDASPLIEEYTAMACPDCTDVCCKQKHGILCKSDINYLLALGEKPLSHDGTRPLEGPCESMGPRGCVKPRWLRPFKCTWFFCEPLLTALNKGPSRKSRRLSAMLQELADLHSALNEG